jgi:hypothetical protein
MEDAKEPTAMDIYTPFTGERTKVVFKTYSTRAEIASKLSDDDVKTDPISQHMFYGPSTWTTSLMAINTK